MTDMTDAYNDWGWRAFELICETAGVNWLPSNWERLADVLVTLGLEQDEAETMAVEL